MMTALGGWWVHTVTVRTYQGSGAAGDVYAAAVTVPCYVDDTRQLVRSATGDEVVSETTVYCDPQYAPLFTTDSLVTVGGRQARVIKCNALDGGPIGPALNHVEVVLT